MKFAIVTTALAVIGTGCQQFWIDSADSIAQRIIQQRQTEVLGATSDTDIGPESGVHRTRDSTYAFVPSPIDSDVPERFREATALDTTGLAEEASTQGLAELMPSADQQADARPRPFTLPEALAYAFQHARDFQTQKEDLYLAALALMTERQLWTPQVVAEVRGEYANFGQEDSFDQAMTAVSEVSATQRLPYGGEVAARVINSLMRDIGRHTTSGETGTMILEANIPLLRGAGRVAYETRYQAERNLIYAVRDFEAARRDLVVDVAGAFFDLLAVKTQIASAEAAAKSAEADVNRSQALLETDRVLKVEADRARVQFLDRSNDIIDARVRYKTALDRFKVRIGMPAIEKIDVVDVDLNLREPDVTQEKAIETALRYRLDLITVGDRIEDARRQVIIAKNNLLPQLDATGRITLDSDPNQIDSLSFNTERTLWQAFVTAEIPIDRREERNVFRASLVDLRRAQRNLDLEEDNVRVDVRDAFRNLEQASVTMEIQRENIEINEMRRIQARALFDRGRLSSNRDVIEAENAYQDAQNQFAQSLANYRLAILTFLRDTGTLRVSDNGMWQ